MGITGGIACVFLTVVIVALIVYLLVRFGFVSKRKSPPPEDDITP
ncbi:hypothetical protein SAMN05444858_1445 [Micromonospora avicenniae]|uniref:Uncharacterized protein n=1 Tax=Micromonospora avicenniae TaxID=1198245 RepID=A0A1N7FQ05_9ACTN|nr:hypothetical protein SAMN05444858_1445 [Micromonospora avicenniae]